MLYMEAPAGVGFSYADDGNYTTNDDQTALDNHMALRYFIMHFPEYAQNEFFITGESYGGIYVPTLAARIVDDSDFNFKVADYSKRIFKMEDLKILILVFLFRDLLLVMDSVIET